MVEFQIGDSYHISELCELVCELSLSQYFRDFFVFRINYAQNRTLRSQVGPFGCEIHGGTNKEVWAVLSQLFRVCVC